MSAVLVGALALVLTACGSSTPSASGSSGTSSSGTSSSTTTTAPKTITTVTMEIPSATGLTYLPYYTGIHYGIFKKYGITLTMQLIKSTLAVSLIQETKLDVMAATGSAENASVKGYKIPTFVAQGLRQDFALVAPKTITSISQLKGKVIIGESAISATNQWEDVVLKQAGLTPKTVQFVTAGSTTARAAYLQAGKGAATALDTIQGLKLQKKGFNILSLGEIPQTELVAGGFATTTKWADAHKTLMKNLVAATVASTQYVLAHKTDAIKVLEGKPYTATATLAKTLYKDTKTNWTPTGKPPQVAITNQLATLQKAYKLKSPPPASEIFTFSFIPKSKS